MRILGPVVQPAPRLLSSGISKLLHRGLARSKAGGQDLHFEGRAEIEPLYAPYGNGPKGIRGGHHSANLAINVALDLRTADVGAYFMTTTPNGVQGGRNEGTMHHCPDGQWRWHRLAITSAWGWKAREFDTVSEPVGLEYSPFGGRHAAYTTP